MDPNGEYEEGDIAIVTTKKGRRFVAKYTLAPGIDYYWNPVLGREGLESIFVDPEVDVEVIGRSK